MVEWCGRVFTLRSPQRSKKMFLVFFIICVLVNNFGQINASAEILDESQSLTPPYFNLALGRNITATATCGEDTDDVPELYCKLTGANTDLTDANVNVIHGQFCDVCDPSDPKKNHNATKAIDGIETWWQSPPLSRGSKYNEVNLTIAFGQEFHVAYVFIKMGNSPRPGLWVLEKSKDYGQTYEPWQYFAESPHDCGYNFGVEHNQPIYRDNSVICTTDYSQIVPLEGGEIPISLLKNRPSANMYFNSTELQEWTRATNVRLRFLRTKTLLGHLMSVARQDPTVTRRYFYSIKDISIGGRCMCNGHADTCQLESKTSNTLICQCVHRTCGPQCAECCPNYVQKKWRQSSSFKPFVCERCNCFNHATECIYDPEVDRLGQSIDIHGNYDGGGVCQNCQHNTEGINCNRCKARFYRPYNKHWNETDVCQPCNCDTFYSTGNCAEGTGQCECKPAFKSPDCSTCSEGYFGYPDCRPCECNINGTRGGQCEAYNGRCACKSNYNGTYCDRCAEGYYDFPKCLPCECNLQGSLDSACNQETGNCNCKNNYQGRICDECSDGFFNYPYCTFCNCDTVGTEPGICDKNNGSCLCKQGYGGDRCDRCIPGYFGYPNCQPCNCSEVGSSSSVCDETGTCSCLSNFASRTCEQCSPGYYKYPECLYCNCYTKGSNGISCDNQGKCQCHENFEGDRCDSCKEGFYNFPNCEECNCHPAGVVQAFTGCGSVPAGQLCECKERVEGRICDKCRPLFWNLNANNPDGCEECTCHVPGVMGAMGVCDTNSGQCVCKPSVTSKECNECKDGSYNLQESNLFGCTDCGCDIGGSVNSICDKTSGQCQCHPRIRGKQCDKPMQNHYFPTLYQYQYEIEDGRTPRNNKVRFGFFEETFPNFSWKGYGVFNDLQTEIIQDVYIPKSSLYRMVLRYINKNSQDVVGRIEIVPDNPSDIEQSFTVVFKPSEQPAFVTVSGIHGLIPSPFVMNPGKWSISLKINKNLLVDYFVLLPAAFYEATILTQNVKTPCVIGEKGFCRHYRYPNINQFDTVHGQGGFTSDGDARSGLKEYHNDINQLRELGENEIPLINNNQLEINFDVTISKTGAYVILINYITPISDNQTVDISVETSDQQDREKGRVVLYPCPYTTVCRQVVTDKDHRVAVFNFNSNNIRTVLKGRDNPQIGIKSVTFIPYEQWSLDYILPQSVCVRKDGLCVASKFPLAPDSKKVQFEIGNEELLSKELPPNIYKNTTQLILLSEQEPMIDVSSKVPSPGNYVFVIHYYQPDHPKFDLSVVVHNGRYYEAHVPVTHCPSNTGCRSIIELNNGGNAFTLTENFVVTLKLPDDKRVWLDYILVIPADSYAEKILLEDKFDQTNEFITKCGQNNFYISTTEEGFCRDSVFSLTAAYNNGAKPCQCDFDGSLSFECEMFGGQCPCKPNIIGRKCEICKAGYYGFPDCQPCNCPITAFCEPNTGQCICLPHVTGPNCDQCEPLTYGFDISIGCEECKCNPLGVLNGNLQCDLLNGNCECKPKVIDRTCSRCSAGYYSFPYCEECECDERGTTEEICDLQTAECFCKANVYGNACDLCVDGSFNLQDSNPEGCTKCFCFGKTTRCTSSDFYRVNIIHMDSWLIAAVQFNEEDNDAQFTPLLVVPEKPDEDTINILGDIDKESLLYISAPEIYLGNKLTAYGGDLTYTVLYQSKDDGQSTYTPDVILKSGDIILLYRSLEQPTSGILFTSTVNIVEQSFSLLNGGSVSRDTLMTALQNLEGIFVRATYWNESISTRISKVSLQVAAPQYIPNSQLASAVEDCQCPPNYVGLSCEECAPGYYRVDHGPHGGYCVPCQCNGHSNTCDVNTGICLNCQHNTAGDHCEQCEIGYHGDATIGTFRDCLICACPVPLASNNFGVRCDVSADGNFISCECKPGYTGSRCESCSNGYYGRPEELNDYCKPCNCSGNIDPTENGACDTVSGECLKCLNNSFGKVCELCAPGFYGDAIQQKNCQRCDCDELGVDYCDNADGTCHCKPNVVGQKCDRCEENHYGFESGLGCLPCGCSIASTSSQCDPNNGQCRCQPGVTGRNCDTCVAGYWNFTENGCTSCGCHSEYSMGVGCNQTTGECTCLKDVKGVKCDHCENRWVFIPDRGCYASDSCVHDLLDVTDAMRDEINPIIDQFETISTNYFTSQRLTYINNTIDKYTPQVAKLNPNNLDLISLNNSFVTLNQNTKNLNQKIEFAFQNANKSIEEAGNVKQRAHDTLQAIKEIADKTYQTVDEVDSIVNRLETGSSVQLDPAIKKSKNISNEISLVNFTTPLNLTTKQLSKSKVLLDKMLNFSQPRNEQSDFLDNLRNQNQDFVLRLENLTNYANSVNENVDKVKDLNDKNRYSQRTSKVDRVNEKINEIEQKLNSSNELVKNATNYYTGAKNAFDNLLSNELELNLIKNTLNDTVLLNDREIDDIRTNLNRAMEYREDLVTKANILEELINKTKKSDVDKAVQAANAYKGIVSDVNNTQSLLNLTNTFNKNASKILNSLQNSGFNSERKSDELLQNAIELLNSVDYDLVPQVEAARNNVSEIEYILGEANKSLNKVHAVADNPKLFKPIVDITGANNKVNYADSQALDATNLSNEINDNLPDKLREAEKLPKVYHDTLQKMNTANDKLENINKILPDLKDLMDQVTPDKGIQQRDVLDIHNKIEKLNEMIAQARDEVNRIDVGVQFYRNSTLQLKNPTVLPSLSTSTKVSFYFKTENKNGFLLYLGNEQGTKLRRTNTDDFMAIEIQNGYPVLTIDLGNGPKKIIGNKYVADNNWYQIIVDRVGKNIKLIVREELPTKEVKAYDNEEKLEGTSSIFNLDVGQSKLFVGGYPLASKLQLQNSDPAFEGHIQELVIGGKPISLWNFVDGSNIRGSKLREKLIDVAPTTGYRFNGKGYMKLDARSYLSPNRLGLSLKLKTEASDGLIFLTAKEESFVSLELRNGFVVYQYKLADNVPAFVQSTEIVNDGKWHKIEAGRLNQNGRLRVDSSTYNLTARGLNTDIKLSDDMYFGGYPGAHNYGTVTNDHFDGCIDEVSIDITPVDLNLQSAAFDVTPGCSPKFHGMVSFDKNHPGYLLYPNATTRLEFEITLSINTLQSDGIIFYATNELQNDTLSLVLSNGDLILQNQNTSLVSSYIKLNDGERYVITATHRADSLNIFVNDYDNFTRKQTLPVRKFTYKHIYFGGIPTSLDVPENRLGSRIPYAGCIEDVILNGVVINFANAVDKYNVILGNCSTSAVLDRPNVPPPSYNIPPPIQPPDLEDNRDKWVPDSVDHTTLGNLDENELNPVTTTTVTTARTRMTQPPKTEECALPLEPETEQIGFNSGYRFGTMPYSRIEFTENTLPIRHKHSMNISIEIKLDEPEDVFSDAVIFYAASKDHSQFTSLVLNKGKLELRFKLGDEVRSILHDRPINDGIWHYVTISRHHLAGKLIVDHDPPMEDILPDENTQVANLQAPFYLGGISFQISQPVLQNVGVNTALYGCIRNFHHNGKLVGQPSIMPDVVPCSEHVEPGIFFTKDGGYVKLEQKFKVGIQFTVQLDIKPRKNTGIILSVHGKKDHLILILKDGDIIVTVKNKDDPPFEATFKPNSPHYFCNGNWHSIKLLKSKNVVTVSVDNVYGTTGKGGPEKRTDTKHGLFIGGHPYAKRLRGFINATDEPYVGCMKNIIINDKLMEIKEKEAFHGVRYNVCPTI